MEVTILEKNSSPAQVSVSSFARIIIHEAAYHWSIKMYTDQLYCMASFLFGTIRGFLIFIGNH